LNLSTGTADRKRRLIILLLTVQRAAWHCQRL